MYADRHARPEGIKPGSLAIAVAINAGLIGALLFSSPEMIARLPVKPLEVTNIFADPPPDPIPPESTAQPRQKTVAPPRERIETTSSIGDPPDSGYVLPPLLPLPPFPGTGTAGTVIRSPRARRGADRRRVRPALRARSAARLSRGRTPRRARGRGQAARRSAPTDG